MQRASHIHVNGGSNPGSWVRSFSVASVDNKFNFEYELIEYKINIISTCGEERVKYRTPMRT